MSICTIKDDQIIVNWVESRFADHCRYLWTQRANDDKTQPAFDKRGSAGRDLPIADIAPRECGKTEKHRAI
jgi:hypothetical protein